MKHKEKQEPKEEKPEQREDAAADFCGLLDTLVPQKSELLRAALEECKNRLKETAANRAQKADYVLELEKEKTKCLLELLKIAVDQYLRTGADYANFQKRVPRDMADSVAYEKEKIMKTLLPALDNFERTLSPQLLAKQDAGEGVLKGIKITYDHMLDILKSNGVEQIKAASEKFDPALHEAITQRNEPEKEDGIVLEELERGYKLNGRVIRPSKVIVNKVGGGRGSGVGGQGSGGGGRDEGAPRETVQEDETIDPRQKHSGVDTE
jgi:molecular chaperone GrpE